MRHSTALALALAGMGLTAVTTAAAVLGFLPRVVWVVTLMAVIPIAVPMNIEND